MIPKGTAASAFSNSQALKVNAGGTIKIANFHVVKADGFQNRTPHHRLIVIQRQTQEAAALLIVDILAACEIRKEQNAVGSDRNLSGAIIQVVVVNRIIGFVAHIVFKPAQGQAAGTNRTPVEISVRKRSGIKDKVVALPA